MQDLIVRVPGHGFSIGEKIFVSWLNGNYFVRDPDNDPAVAADSFKISSDDSDGNIVPFTGTVKLGFVGAPRSGSGTGGPASMFGSWGW